MVHGFPASETTVKKQSSGEVWIHIVYSEHKYMNMYTIYIYIHRYLYQYALQLKLGNSWVSM